MIKSDVELRKLESEKDILLAEINQQIQQLKDREVQEADIPLFISFLTDRYSSLNNEIAFYKHIKTTPVLHFNVRELGRFLVASRIMKGISQKDLAKTLKVSESLISRDESNEYSGISLERASKILEAMDVNVECILTVHQHDTTVNISSVIDISERLASKFGDENSCSASKVHEFGNTFTVSRNAVVS